MQLLINNIDFTQRYDTLSLSGSVTVCARTLTLGLNVSSKVEAFAIPTIPTHAPVTLYDDDNTLIFQGVVVQIHHDGSTAILSITCMDYGYFLANNTGWYDVANTPEVAIAAIAADIGLSVSSLAETNVTVSRCFAGDGIYKIINTLYTLASQTTGLHYHIRFVGDALSVVAKPETATLTLDPSANIYTSTNTVDVSDYCNTVVIHDETGTEIQTIGGSEELAGMLRQHITQRDGEDATGEAELLIEDSAAVQTVTVSCPGDMRLVTGNAITIVETTTGVSGLFWIDSDTHVWQNGNHTVTLDLNCRNIMNETTAGSEAS